MYQILNSLHFYNRYVLLALLVFVLFRAFSGWFGNKSYEKADNATSAALLGFTHLQLLLGLLLLFVFSPRTKEAFSDMGATMKDSTLRYFTVEHTMMMLAAVVLIQLGRTFSKKTTDPVKKHKTVAVYTSIALLLILVSLGMKGIIFSRFGM